jgi:ABC-2 type transport system ATP-binding protein
MEALRTERLYKRFKDLFVLGPFDLRVDRGEILGVMGPNGSGKTTLLRLLWGFLRPDEGRISVFGMQPHLEQVKVRLRAGYLAGNPRFYSCFTARELLKFIGNFYQGWDESRTERLLQEFGVQPTLRIEELSHGDRMKVGVISAVGHHPSLVILDEPLSGLDPRTRMEILAFVRTLAKKENVAFLISSHISDDLDHTADSILMLKDGRAVEYARGHSA